MDKVDWMERHCEDPSELAEEERQEEEGCEDESDA